MFRQDGRRMTKLLAGTKKRSATTALPDSWLDACRAGRPEALAELFSTHRPVVERLLGRLVGPTPDLEDLVQSTFVEVLRNLHRFRGEAKLATWICGIGVHIAHRHLRAGKIRRHVSLELVASLSSSEDQPNLAVNLTDSRPSADQSIDSRRLAIKLHTLLDRLTAKKRIALMLYVMEDKPVEEIAALMDATQTTTRSRMYFARRELRKLIMSDPALEEWTSTLFKHGLGGKA
jgi:RNA polymerase sigma-70 factor (ECF subfamily)